MLKPADPRPIGPDEERPVGELVHQLVEDGKSYARAELDLVKVIAAAKGKALAMPAAMIGGALLFAIAAVCVLATATFLALLPLVGPFFAGVLAFLIFGGIAGLLGWLAINKAKKDL